MTASQCIGVLAHPLRPQTFPVAAQIAASLEAHQQPVCLFTAWEAGDIRETVRACRMVIAIGGDGAMLRAARVCAPFGVPVLGVNMGQLGFLTEIRRVEDWDAVIAPVLAGDFWIEQRMMLGVVVLRGDERLHTEDALNDVVISGEGIGHMILLDTYIDGNWTTTYYADALVIATATGSTAYALACGGPILPPELNNLLVIPAAPHLSMDRPIVLSEGSQVEVRAASGHRGPVVLTADGVLVSRLQAGDRVVVQASDHITRFVRLRERNYFYRSLLDRLEPRVRRPDFEPRTDQTGLL